MLDCKELHGCMQLVKHGHLSGNVATHTNCSGDTWYTDLCQSIIEKELLDGKDDMDDLVVEIEKEIEAVEVTEIKPKIIPPTVPKFTCKHKRCMVCAPCLQ